MLIDCLIVWFDDKNGLWFGCCVALMVVEVTRKRREVGRGGQWWQDPHHSRMHITKIPAAKKTDTIYVRISNFKLAKTVLFVSYFTLLK